MINFVQEYGFSQAVNFPTRGNNILDVFITNRPSLVHSCSPIAGISDHEAVYIESSVSITHQQCAQRKSFLWHKADMVGIKEIINQFSNTFLSKYSLSTPVDILWNEFKQMCFDCLSHVPTKHFSTGTKQPWVTNRIKRLSRKTQRLYNLARQSNCSRNWDSYRCFKREVQRECSNAYNNYIEGLVNSNGTVSKRLRNFIKSQKKDHCGVAPLKVENSVINNSSTKAQILNDYFTSVFTPVTEEALPMIHEQSKPDINPILVETNGVLELLRTLDVHKVCGPDGIPTNLLKETCEEIAPSLSFISKPHYNNVYYL